MIDITTLQNRDLHKLTELIMLYEDVFEMTNFVMPNDAYLQSLLDKNGIIFLVAIMEGQVIGGLTAHELPSTYFEASEIYVYDLAVAKKYQRQGIGKKLLFELARICKKKGVSEFFLQADLEDEYAIKFYRSIGGKEENVIHFSYDTNG